MLNIAICDDEMEICSGLETMITNYMNTSGIKMNIDVFYSGDTLSSHLKDIGTYDLIFLDIEIGESSGIEIGKSLRDDKKDELTKIVYISWKSGYAMDLFQIRPLNFLVKPVEQAQVISCIDKCLELLGEQSEYFLYKKDNKVKKIATRDILYFESANRVIKIHKQDVVEEFYGKLDEIATELNELYFWRIHKSYLINSHHATIVELKKITMRNNKVLPISQPNRTIIRTLQRNSMR